MQVIISSGGKATVLALTFFPKSPLEANGQAANLGNADEAKEGVQVLGGVRAEVLLLPYRIHLVSVRNHSYSTPPAVHRGDQGPLVRGGIVRFGCDQAFGSVEPSTDIHLLAGGKVGEQGRETLGGEDIEEKMNGLAGFWGELFVCLGFLRGIFLPLFSLDDKLGAVAVFLPG